MSKLNVKCPGCSREWPYVSEQASAIVIVGGCVKCKVNDLTDADFEKIEKELNRRANEEQNIICESIRDNQEADIPEPETMPIEMALYRDGRLMGIKSLMIAVVMENYRQIEKWGIQVRTSFEWNTYLAEEVGELAEAILEHEYTEGNSIRKENIFNEAIQVATLALKIAEMYGAEQIEQIRAENEDLIEPTPAKKENPAVQEIRFLCDINGTRKNVYKKGDTFILHEADIKRGSIMEAPGVFIEIKEGKDFEVIRDYHEESLASL